MHIQTEFKMRGEVELHKTGRDKFNEGQRWGNS